MPSNPLCKVIAKDKIATCIYYHTLKMTELFDLNKTNIYCITEILTIHVIF